MPSKSPSPDLLVARYGAKTVIGSALEGVEDRYDSEDMRSTVGGASVLEEESRSTVFPDEVGEANAVDNAKNPANDVDFLRLSARNVLEQAAMNGSLDEAVSGVLTETRKELTVDSGNVATAQGGPMEALRREVGDMLTNAAEDGRLAALLSEADKTAIAQDDVRLVTRGAMSQGLENGSLDTLLAEASGQQTGNTEGTILVAAPSSTEETREVTRSAILEGLQSGRLDALLAEASGQTAPQPVAPSALVPKPPTGGVPVSSYQSPIRTRRLLGGGSAVTQVMEMISDADRKVGYLNVELDRKTKDLKDRAITEQRLLENIKFVRSDIEHLAVDLQWHQEQIGTAEGRHGRLNEDRRALASKLDEIRMDRLKDDWPVDTKQLMGRSWASTITGGAATAIESASSGWTTARSVAESTQVPQADSTGS
jgi:hypothetical protein